LRHIVEHTATLRSYTITWNKKDKIKLLEKVVILEGLLTEGQS